MTAANEQIVTAFEESHLSPEQIAETLEYDVTAVKAILFQNSSLYRKEAKGDDALSFTTDEAEEMKTIILQLARYGEEETLRFKAAKYVRDDKLGRLDNPSAAKGLNQFNFNVVTFGEHLKKAVQAQLRASNQEVEQKKVIDVSTT